MKMSSGAIRRRLACLTVLLLVASVGASESQEIGSFFVGMNYAVSGNELQNNFTTYKVDDPGITLGFVLPIFLRTYGLHYKGTVSFNGVEDLEFGSAPAPWGMGWSPNT